MASSGNKDTVITLEMSQVLLSTSPMLPDASWYIGQLPRSRPKKTPEYELEDPDKCLGNVAGTDVQAAVGSKSKSR